jgi:uncharacterized protein HemY
VEKSDRIEKLQTMLRKNPTDAFLLYALGMEYKKTNPSGALEMFRKVTQVEPNHGYAYYQLGQTHELAGDTALAAAAYRDGLVAARRGGDAHAAQEIEAALQLISP